MTLLIKIQKYKFDSIIDQFDYAKINGLINAMTSIRLAQYFQYATK